MFSINDDMRGGEGGHLSTGKPCRARPEAAEAGPKRTPEESLGIVLKRLSFRVSLGYL